MKIAVISDTHSNSISKNLLNKLKGMDMIIHAGDLIELSVLDCLKSINSNIKAVSGNMDTPKVKKILPESRILNAGNYKIGITHGRGSPEHLLEFVANKFKNHKLDIIIFGHSHRALNKRIGPTLFFNPGSLTDKVFAEYNSFGILELNDKINAKIVRIQT